MELFRVGGDVPDTNYLFMGKTNLNHIQPIFTPLIKTLRRLRRSRLLFTGIFPPFALPKSSIPR